MTLAGSITLDSVQVCTSQYKMFKMSFYGTQCISQIHFESNISEFYYFYFLISQGNIGLCHVAT